VGTYRHVMGLHIDEVKEFFIRILIKLGFEVEQRYHRIKAFNDKSAVLIELRELESEVLSIPRTEVLINAPEEVHKCIKTQIMRLRMGG